MSPASISAPAASAAAASWIRPEAASASAASALAATARSTAAASAACASAITAEASSTAAISAPIARLTSPAKKSSLTSAPPAAETESISGPAHKCSTSSNATALPGSRESARARTSATPEPAEQRAEILAVTDLQPLYRAVLSLGQEDHVKHAQHAAALDPVNLRQQAAFSIDVEAESQRDHLQRCRHMCSPSSGSGAEPPSAASHRLMLTPILARLRGP